MKKLFLRLTVNAVISISILFSLTVSVFAITPGPNQYYCDPDPINGRCVENCSPSYHPECITDPSGLAPCLGPYNLTECKPNPTPIPTSPFTGDCCNTFDAGFPGQICPGANWTFCGDNQYGGQDWCQNASDCPLRITPAPGPGPTISVYDPGCTITTFIQGGRTRVDTQGVKTALGCLPVNPQNFVDIAIPWTIGIGAGIAFLLGIFGSMMIVLSAGNPEKMQAGKEMITSAIAGTIIIIFAVFLLDFIGVKVLKLFSF